MKGFLCHVTQSGIESIFCKLQLHPRKSGRCQYPVSLNLPEIASTGSAMAFCSRPSRVRDLIIVTPSYMPPQHRVPITSLNCRYTLHHVRQLQIKLGIRCIAFQHIKSSNRNWLPSRVHLSPLLFNRRGEQEEVAPKLCVMSDFNESDRAAIMVPRVCSNQKLVFRSSNRVPPVYPRDRILGQ